MRFEVRDPGLGLRRFYVALAVTTGCLSISCASASGSSQSGSSEIVQLWRGQPPGTADWTGVEESADVKLPNLGKVHVITNITVPTLTVFRPPAGKSNGAAMVVVPGGAFRALPWDLDGVETAHWLNKRGITAFVLKYRVRPPASDAPVDRSFEDFARRTKPARDIAVADAEQAMRLVRSRSRNFGVASDRVGMIGFSAGAMTTVIVANASDPAVRPNFAVALYGALLSSSEPTAAAAPLFIVAAQDDPEAPSSRSVELYARWTKAKRPAELHIYQRGGHGFGFRRHFLPVDEWPRAFEAWLTTNKYIPKTP